jgi:DNA adenine methylase
MIDISVEPAPFAELAKRCYLDPAQALKLWEGPVGVEKVSEAGAHYHFQVEIPVLKREDEKQIVTGIVLEPDEVDAQGDTIGPEPIERTAHNFLARYNRETQLGVMHKMFENQGIELVESWVSPHDFSIGTSVVKKGSWLMSVRVKSADLWKRIKQGEINGFSIGGIATVVAP